MWAWAGALRFRARALLSGWAPALLIVSGVPGGALLRPPSSLQPSVSEVEVRVSHTRQRVCSCAVHTGSEPSCSAELEDADAATRVVLRPSTEPSSTADKPAQPVSVELPRGSGRQSRSVRLRPGEWLVDWPGYSELARLAVTASAPTPEVKLSTLSGHCELRRSRCVLVRGGDVKRVQISAVSRAAN